MEAVTVYQSSIDLLKEMDWGRGGGRRERGSREKKNRQPRTEVVSSRRTWSVRPLPPGGDGSVGLALRILAEATLAASVERQSVGTLPST